MSEIDLIILGLIKEQPQSAYDLQKEVNYRNISYWVHISTPAIYRNVKLLEQNEFIRGKLMKEGNLPQKVVYEITESGEQYFNDAMKEISGKKVHFFLELNAVILNMRHADDEVREECIQQILFNVHALSEHIDKMKDEKKEIPIRGQMIMEQQQKLARVLEDWIAECESKMKTGEI